MQVDFTPVSMGLRQKDIKAAEYIKNTLHLPFIDAAISFSLTLIGVLEDSIARGYSVYIEDDRNGKIDYI